MWLCRLRLLASSVASYAAAAVAAASSLSANVVRKSTCSNCSTKARRSSSSACSPTARSRSPDATSGNVRALASARGDGRIALKMDDDDDDGDDDDGEDVRAPAVMLCPLPPKRNSIPLPPAALPESPPAALRPVGLSDWRPRWGGDDFEEKKDAAAIIVVVVAS